VELKIMFEKWKQEEEKKIQERMLLRGARRLLRVIALEYLFRKNVL
jgi:hypothetical protein